MQKIKRILYFLLFISQLVFAQETLDELLKKYNTDSIPYISVQEFSDIQDQVVILDAREKKEYEVSHIKNAMHVGYIFFKRKKVSRQNFPKDTMIVIYCSLGIRSEDISRKLVRKGYTNVHNLYGGIFEWKNKNLPVFDADENPTEKVHAFSEEWSTWLTGGEKYIPHEQDSATKY